MSQGGAGSDPVVVAVEAPAHALSQGLEGHVASAARGSVDADDLCGAVVEEDEDGSGAFVGAGCATSPLAALSGITRSSKVCSAIRIRWLSDSHALLLIDQLGFDCFGKYSSH